MYSDDEWKLAVVELVRQLDDAGVYWSMYPESELQVRKKASIPPEAVERLRDVIASLAEWVSEEDRGAEVPAAKPRKLRGREEPTPPRALQPRSEDDDPIVRPSAADSYRRLRALLSWVDGS